MNKKDKAPEKGRCCEHKDSPAVEHCVSCGRSICAKCANQYQIYSVSSESGEPYCKACYEKAVRYIAKNR